ncbi:MAG: NUDIX hydrolase [Actinomycetota bacterium]|nr:NUDIX hydrolase [Actinomycetota bacterium]
MSKAEGVVQAAGGVVTRTARDGTLEVLVVHRPRYDDWSLPKGKLEPGESFEDAARREIEEETGVRVELGAALPTTDYVDRHGRPKVVHYWRMTPVGETAWEPSDEVDETRWITVAEAGTILSYEHDRRLVAAVDDSAPGGQS